MSSKKIVNRGPFTVNRINIKSITKYYSRIFRDFRSIQQNDYQRIIRFFEARSEDIEELEFIEYYDLLISYVDALFYTGEFSQHLKVVDHAIELAMHHEAPEDDGNELFQHLLYTKAMSHSRCLEPSRSEYVCKELLRINPLHEGGRKLLRKSLFRQQRQLLQNSRAIAILCFALVALVVLLEVLIVRNFYATHADTTEWIRNIIFALGCLSIIIGFGYSFLKAHSWMRQFVVDQQLRKA